MGVSYNSYVILDEKIAVMDSVDARAEEEWLSNVAQVLEGRNPDYLEMCIRDSACTASGELRGNQGQAGADRGGRSRQGGVS